jgi:hypothetical protein
MDGVNAGENESGGSSDSKAIIYGTVFGILGLWLLGVVVSTKGCRKFGYDHKYRYNNSNTNNNNDNGPAEEDNPVWVQASFMTQAERLQRQQQRQQAAADDSHDDAVFLQERSPEELAAMIEEIQEKVTARTAFLERTLLRLDYDAGMHKGDKCTICLTAYTPKDCLTGSNRNSNSNSTKDGSDDDYCCLHHFHRDCIKDWLVGKAICPVCRNVFLEQDAKRLKKQVKTTAGSGEDETPSSGEEQKEECVVIEDDVDVIAAGNDEEAANLDIAQSEVTGGAGITADAGARQ